MGIVCGGIDAAMEQATEAFPPRREKVPVPSSSIRMLSISF
jgi:hypothetical protein